MCKFCEFNLKLDQRDSSSYAAWNGRLVIYKSYDGQHYLEDEDFNFSVEIEYCPYCGRKLSGE